MVSSDNVFYLQMIFLEAYVMKGVFTDKPKIALVVSK